MKCADEVVTLNSRCCNRLSTLEKLVLCTSHRLNNSLTVLKLELESKNNQTLRRQVDLICDMVQLLQRFTHLSNIHSGPFQLNDYVATAVQLSRLLLHHQNEFTVVCQYEPSLPEVHGNPEHLQQLVIDIVCYCLERMSDADEKLTVTTYRENRYSVLDIGNSKAKHCIEIVGGRPNPIYFDGQYDRFKILMPNK